MVRTKIGNVLNSFQEHFYERDEEIRGALLAIFANENILYLGPPGTAKTYLAQSICKLFDDANFFYYLLTRFTTPEEIFGPLSLKALENDEFKRNTEGSLPSANIALLDEIFKANSSILNSLLTILNERKYHNGAKIVDTELYTVFGASNELPEEDENLEALYDRFLFRYSTGYIQNEDNVKNLLFSSPKEFIPTDKLSLNDISKIRKRAEDITFDQDVIDILMNIRKDVNRKDPDGEFGYLISDRRWKKITASLRTAAASNGDDKVPKSMVLLLTDMLWDNPDQKEEIREIVKKHFVNGYLGNKFDHEIQISTLSEELEKEENYDIEDRPLPNNIFIYPRRTEYYRNKPFARIENTRDLYYKNLKYPGCVYHIDGRFRDSNNCFEYDKLINILHMDYNFTFADNLKPELKSKIIEGIKYLKLSQTKLKEINKNFDEIYGNLIEELEENVWITADKINEIKYSRYKYQKAIEYLEEVVSDDLTHVDEFSDHIDTSYE